MNNGQIEIKKDKEKRREYLKMGIDHHLKQLEIYEKLYEKELLNN